MRLAVLAACSALLFACSSNDNNGGFACTNGLCPAGYKCVDENGAKVCRPGNPPDASTADSQPKTEGPVADPCASAADGTDCSSVGGAGFICLNKKCTASSCGDKFVDTQHGEDCDDGNTVPDDGCDACKFNCKADSGCDDKNPCNGAETCDTSTHKCKPGKPADGADCTLSGGGAGVCNGGTCAPKGCGNGIKDGTEECDDGNKVDGDGCNNDCTFSCHKDADCDDKTVCTGTETCDLTKHTCKPGTPLNCDDGKACTTDSCDPVKGCINTPIDADKDGHAAAPCGDDCNDNDPTIFPGAIDCPDGKDNDCNGKIDDNPTATGKCWADPDGDTYAATTAATISACNCPSGYTNRDPSVAGNADCMAGLKDVNPGQYNFFTNTYCAGKIFCQLGQPCTCSQSSWDYNCNGKDDQQYTNLAGTSCTKCTGLFCFILCGGSCCGSGWIGGTVPACGAGGAWQNCVLDNLGVCVPQNGTRTQGCN